MTLIIKDKPCSILFEFPVLYSGWECDEKGYVVDVDGKSCIVLTSHGRTYFAKNAELEFKIKEYKEAIKKSEQALRMAYGQKE